ncbi:MAG: hypothetical protein UV05_C0041G0001 [candidate division CPR1 bacterium GW2011_GWA2_42_17]|uniref:Uncharacterized protein n=1 Tax=candidate division CPR1 bacterium GW2011_GWA2_42_17 TaxID=1618341 RepID=A0A0G0Z154_9BACT|nr:MAG: hypothetical protein UV05_C0041G0001 [candidate division CPR1 bacterium GW2011_GWA2_42_17]
MGRKKHILPERNYSFSGYFRCETGENISAFFSDKTRAVSEKEAANNIRFNICKKFNLFFNGRPFKIELYDYTIKVITTPIAPPSLEPPAPVKKGSPILFDND